MRYALALLLALTAANAEAATYKVCSAVGGSCTHDCSTLPSLYSSGLANGDTVQFEEGLTCSLTGTLTAAPNLRTNITFIGLGSGATLDWQGLYGSPGIAFWKGFRLENMTLKRTTGACMDCASGDEPLTLYNVTLDECGTLGVDDADTGSVFDRVLCRLAGTGCFDGSTKSITVRNSIIDRPNQDGTNVSAVIATGASTVIEGNTVYGAPAGANRANYVFQANNASKCHGNVVLDNETNFGAIYCPTANETYNISHGNTGGDFQNTMGTGSSTSDPLLTAPASGDFSLTSGSPAIDAATGSTLTEDFAGTTRDATPDIGALEYVVSATARLLNGGVQGKWLDGGVQGFLLYGGANE